jgi:hypothetical protein
MCRTPFPPPAASPERVTQRLEAELRLTKRDRVATLMKIFEVTGSTILRLSLPRDGRIVKGEQHLRGEGGSSGRTADVFLSPHLC